MENSKGEINNKSTDENPIADPPSAISAATVNGDAPPTTAAAVNPPSNRTPFTNLSQVDADLALARTLQEQERAYMMLRMNAEGSDYESWEGGSYFHEDFDDASGEEYDGSDDDEDIDDEDEDEDDDDEDDEDDDEDEDAFDVNAREEDDDDIGVGGVELDPASFPNDEAYARALQDAEDREMAARLLALAGLNERQDEEDTDDHGDNSQDTWDEIDPDQLSYEELIALGEIVGTESRGLSADTISSLPSISYKNQKVKDANNDSCVICRLDYEDDDTLTVLSCKHSYHSECINNWLKINKICPICSTEVSTSGKT